MIGPVPGSSAARDAVPPDIQQNPVVIAVRELCDAGKVGNAIRLAFDRGIADTVRAYGLAIPLGCTSLEFVSHQLRPDMGKLCELLPELYRLYEPVRFGGFSPTDPQPIRALVERIYSETSLAWVYDPRFQPKGPADRASAPTFSVARRTPAGPSRRS